MITLLTTLTNWLAAGSSVASATIAVHEGSTPRGAGGKMIVRADGAMHGTVGGGLVEARVLEAAARMFQGGQAGIMDFDLSGELASVGEREASFPLLYGRGDQVRKGGSAPDPREQPTRAVRTRDIYWGAIPWLVLQLVLLELLERQVPLALQEIILNTVMR